jgi:U32 family peptidase
MTALKIAMPVSSFQEMDMLLHFGADEFYCGLRTPEWERHFGGACWMNRRSPNGANIGSWQEMSEIVGKAHAAGKSVHVTLNAPFYTDKGISYLLDLTEQLVERLHIDGVIVSDINFMLRLARQKYPLNLHLSSLGACINSYSVQFYHSIGVKRIILPRQMSLLEIQQIVSRNNDTMQFEVFALNDGCFFEEGFCQTMHSMGGPLCLMQWDVTARESSIEKAELAKYQEQLRQYLWYQNNCGSSFQQDGLPNGPCSLCRFGLFRNWGVTSVKIVGREASFLRKMRSLQLTKAVADQTNRGARAEDIADFARNLRRTPQYCKKGYMCYFR